MNSATSYSESKEVTEKREANQRSIDLMFRVSQGDTEAFQTLVETHQCAVIGAATKMLGSPVEAEDIAQQVFLRVWKAAPRYQPMAQFNTWLFKITRNLVYNETRRRQRKPTVSVEACGLNNHHLATDDNAVCPASNAQHSEFEEAVEVAIESLPDRQRTSLLLRRNEEMPYLEIARRLSTTEPAVKKLLFRARTNLKSSLRHHLTS
jgi:RNA polymerase sigma-70 factor (ECF subfamily)